MVKDVTNSPKDVNDFWYNSQKDLPDWTNNEIPPYVPKTVSSTERKSFDELYEEFKSKSIEDQVENLKGLGRQLVSSIDRIVDRLNVIVEDIEEEESNNKEEEITIDPLTHKVLYNTKTNEYKVVRIKH